MKKILINLLSFVIGMLLGVAALFVAGGIIGLIAIAWMKLFG